MQQVAIVGYSSLGAPHFFYDTTTTMRVIVETRTSRTVGGWVSSTRVWGCTETYTYDRS